MKSLYMRAGCATLAVWGLACKGDPTADLRGGPNSINLVPSQVFVDEGKATSLLVAVEDEQLNPLTADVTVTSSDQSVVKVAVDTTRPSADGARHAYVITAVAPGHTKLMVSGGGLSDSVPTSVLPLAFNGAISSLTPKIGDTLTIQSTAVLTFNPATVAVTFGGDQPAFMLTKTANTLTMIVPSSDPAPLTINGIVVTYVTGLEVTLPTASVVHQTGDRWAGLNSWQTAADLSGVLPASGANVQTLVGIPAVNNASVCPEVVLGFGSAGPCMIFKFTLAATTTLNFTTDWASGDGGKNPDMDTYACSDSTVANFGANCFEDGGAGAASNNPEITGNHAYAAGTHYFVIEYYAACDDTDPTKCTTDGKTRNYHLTISRP